MLQTHKCTMRYSWFLLTKLSFEIYWWPISIFAEICSHIWIYLWRWCIVWLPTFLHGHNQDFLFIYLFGWSSMHNWPPQNLLFFYLKSCTSILNLFCNTFLSLGGASFIIRMSICKCTNRGINLNFVVLHIHMLHKLYLVVMYMYAGPLENIQLLYFYDSVTRLHGKSI